MAGTGMGAAVMVSLLDCNARFFCWVRKYAARKKRPLRLLRGPHPANVEYSRAVDWEEMAVESAESHHRPNGLLKGGKWVCRWRAEMRDECMVGGM